MSRNSGKIKEIEEFPRRIKIFSWTVVFVLVIGTLGFWIIDKQGIDGAFLRTLETLAFIFQEEKGVARFLEIFLALVGVFVVWWVLWSVADMLLDGNLTKYLRLRFYTRHVKSMKNHCIVVGGGRVGEEIARVLKMKKKQFVIVEKNVDQVIALRKKGYVVIEGDALREGVLEQANIIQAQKIILTLPKSETNLLMTISAQEINPEIEIYARAERQSYVSKLKKAGAKTVIVPEIVAADKLAEDIDL